MKFAYEVSLSYSQRSLTRRKILRHGANSFTSHSKEVVLRIFISLKNQSPSAGFEPAQFRQREINLYGATQGGTTFLFPWGQ
jgi:hypothetical protein